ncbi:hypothetical protein Gotri_017821 [Gossypium trilobum]|uniref:Uncharacterized protein n=1 Tax=Gossypium trilobum TaxID=34281 RepID=A0A7J9E7M8_9ROSI|nr:hypothetical protein [Gossypium trilobum]
MGANSLENKSRSRFWSTVFGRCKCWPRRISISTGSIPNQNNNNVKTSNWNTRWGRSDVDQGLDGGSYLKSPPNHSMLVVVHQQNQVCKPPVESTRITTTNQRKVPKEAISISGELESMIMDYQKIKGNNSNLVRASSGNFMLYGHLGNLRQPVEGENKKEDNKVEEKPEPPSPQCKALATRRDSEKLKNLGNIDYNKGNFGEALSLYEAAIAIDPFKASYRTYRSAALEASGRILEAVSECREAIRIEPRHHRAHHRLGNLYIRLGEVEKAMYHLKRAGPEADSDHITKAKTLQERINKCTEAKRLRTWNVLVRETDSAIKAGADSSPFMYAFKAEALLKLHRHQEANETLLQGPKYNDEDCIKHFGPIGNANLLVVQAKVDMALGRFDDALAAMERAVRLDSNSKEANSAMSKARALATFETVGNEHFKTSNFYDACISYGEGLAHDTRNSVLLLNRAICYSKLGQDELAIEDCTRALSVRPGYTKARLKRAHCNSKLEKWEASIEDYEILKKETPNDEEVKQGLSKARRQLKNKKTG